MAAPSTASRRRESYATQLSSDHSNNIVGHTVLGTWAKSHLIPLPSLYGGKRSSFVHLAPPDDMVNSESMVGN